MNELHTSGGMIRFAFAPANNKDIILSLLDMYSCCIDIPYIHSPKHNPTIPSSQPLITSINYRFIHLNMCEYNMYEYNTTNNTNTPNIISNNLRPVPILTSKVCPL